MPSDEILLGKAIEWAGAPMALATVISTWGSAPRPAGSHMLVRQDGRFEGSVSGGCVEADIMAAAAEVIGGAPFQLRRYGVANAQAWDFGLPCGGQIEVLVQRVSSDGFPPDLFERIADATAQRKPLAVTTDLATGMSWEGSEPAGGHFVNQYRPAPRLVIVGAVQIAQALTAIADSVGFDVIVNDPRTRFLTRERFPTGRLDDRWPDEAITALRVDAATAVVALSHDPKIDDPALVAALQGGAGYVAALGSRRNHAARLERLAAMSLPHDMLARIEGPAGLPIGAIGPAEIGLSIAAAMVKALRSPPDAADQDEAKSSGVS